jgi:hypothetical protein
MSFKGEILWETCIFNDGYSINYKPTDICQNSLGELYVTGTFMDVSNLVYSNYKGIKRKPINGKGLRDIFLCKLSANGDPIWEKIIGGSRVDYPVRLLQKTNHTIMLLGYTYSADGDLLGTNKRSLNENSDIVAIKLDSSGTILQKKCFGGNGEELLNDAKIDKDDNYKP